MSWLVPTIIGFMTKPVFRFSDQVGHPAVHPKKMARGLEISDLGYRGIVLSCSKKQRD